MTSDSSMNNNDDPSKHDQGATNADNRPGRHAAPRMMLAIVVGACLALVLLALFVMNVLKPGIQDKPQQAPVETQR